MEHINLKAFDDLVKITYKGADIFLIDNFFKYDTFKKIQTHLNDIKNKKDYWSKLDKQEEYPRRNLIKREGILNEINLEFSNNEYISVVNEKFGWSVESGGLSIWHDYEGYSINLHVDNDRVKHAIQIYLSGFNTHLGTSFAKNNRIGSSDIFMTIPYKENFGYCMKNVDVIEHGLINKVPSNFDRYSLYSILG